METDETGSKVGGIICQVKVIGKTEAWPGPFPLYREQYTDEDGNPRPIAMTGHTIQEMLDAGVKLEFVEGGAVDNEARFNDLRT